MSPVDTRRFVTDILNKEQWDTLNELGEFDLSVSVQGMFRYRVNVYKQRISMLRH